MADPSEFDADITMSYPLVIQVSTSNYGDDTHIALGTASLSKLFQEEYGYPVVTLQEDALSIEKVQAFLEREVTDAVGHSSSHHDGIILCLAGLCNSTGHYLTSNGVVDVNALLASNIMPHWQQRILLLDFTQGEPAPSTVVWNDKKAIATTRCPMDAPCFDRLLERLKDAQELQPW